MIRHALILTVALALFWLGLSGYFEPLLLTFGVISIAIVLLLSGRMGIFDFETAPYLFIPKTLSYFAWLGGEVFKANVTVAKAVLKPDMNISPSWVRIPLRGHNDMGAAMFANSITLTPGTVSVDIPDEAILVHALLEDMAVADDFMEMSERAGWAVGDNPMTPRIFGGT